MPDPRDLPLFRWGEELRRHRRMDRRWRLRLAGIAAAALLSCALLGTLLWPPAPLLVWNVTRSSPLGLYQVSPARSLSPGHFVIAWPPDAARLLAAERRYLPSNVPLVKEVAAVAGDRVCAVGEAVFVNGRFEAFRRTQDSAGRSLPGWTGCHDLQDGELFLLLPGRADSFDGRYFGPTRRAELIGKARPLWRW